MATEIRIINQKYYKQLFNDSTFSTDLTNNVANLAGLVMQKIKLYQKIRVQWFSRMTAADNSPSNMQWNVLQPTLSTLKIARNDGGDFLKDGFFVNDTVRTVNRSTSFIDQTFSGGTITFVDKTYMEIIFASPQSTLQSNIKAWLINGTTLLTSLIYNYGLIENNDTYSTTSLVTNENQGWYTPSDITGTYLSMVGLGLPKSWENGEMRVRSTSVIVDTYDYWQEFEIEHEFIIPYFNAGEIQDLNNNVIPDYLDGLNSLKYVFDVDFRTVISNPNTRKKNTVDNILGSIGYFGEAFNGLDSNYELTNVVYTDILSNSANGILIGETTYIAATIEKISGTFNANDVALVYFSYLPELQSEVENTTTNFETNFIYDNIRNVSLSPAQTGTNVLNNMFVNIVGNIMTIQFETSFTLAQQLKLSNQKSYLLGFEVADINISSGNSDNVILKEVQLFDDSSDIPDLMTFDTKLFPYTSAFTGAGFTSFNGWNEHGLALKGNFILDLTKDAFINSFKVYLIAYRSSDENYFVLDEYDYNLPNTILSSGGYNYQLLDMSTTRNYPLALGSEKNGVSIELDPLTIGTSSPKYNFTFAEKIRWETWIKNVGVDTVFTNNSEPQNNLNYKASNYSFKEGYNIKMLYSFNVAGTSYLNVSGNTDYNFFTPDFIIRDYDEDGNTTPNFTQVIETFTSNGLTNLGGVIQTGLDTLMKITWTPISTITSISNFWGIHRIEESGQTGQQIHELGTFETNETNQLFKPITTTFLDIVLISGNIVTTCLIDGSKIQAGVSYNLSGEIGSPPDDGGGGGVRPTAKKTEDNISKITESNNTKIIE